MKYNKLDWKNIFLESLNIKQITFVTIFLFSSLIVFLFFKTLFFILLFCGIIFIKDIAGNYFKIGSPVSLNDIGLIYCSYAFSPIAGISVIMFSLLSKLYFGRLQSHHFLKAGVMAISSFIIYYFRNIELFILSIIIITTRYLFEYLLDLILIKRFDLKESINRIWRTTLTLIIIYYTKDILLRIMI